MRLAVEVDRAQAAEGGCEMFERNLEPAGGAALVVEIIRAQQRGEIGEGDLLLARADEAAAARFHPGGASRGGAHRARYQNGMTLGIPHRDGSSESNWCVPAKTARG